MKKTLKNILVCGILYKEVLSADDEENSDHFRQCVVLGIMKRMKVQNCESIIYAMGLYSSDWVYGNMQSLDFCVKCQADYCR